ncbi:MAG: MFS transporter [Humibacillus sp.]|nr:MFS transporter [Humibacillus sp.]MDN5778522.1 MFS transporter [Humibacillus sp.]
MLATCAGNAVEWYDFAIYGALAGALGQAFFPTDDASTSLLAAFALYSTAFFFRPAGAVLLGALGDRWGSRRVLLIAVAVMTAATVAVAAVPSYAAIGLVAPVLVVALRGLQGVASGGQIGVLGAYLVEAAPAGARARNGAGFPATAALGIALGMVVAGGVSSAVGAAGLSAGWWRLPFVLALPLGLVGFFMRRTLLETEVMHPNRQRWPPTSGAADAKGSERADLVRAFTLVAGGALAFNVFFIFLPAYAVTHGASPGPVLLLTALVLLAAAVMAYLIGQWSDRRGRRPVMLLGSTVLAVGGPGLVLLAESSLLGLVMAQAAAGAAAAGLLNPAAPVELFTSAHRSRNMGLTAGLATALVGGTGPLVATVLARVTGSLVSVGGYVALVSLLGLVALRRWPETAFDPLR